MLHLILSPPNSLIIEISVCFTCLINPLAIVTCWSWLKAILKFTFEVLLALNLVWTLLHEALDQG